MAFYKRLTGKILASWDNFYKLEKENFEQNPQDTGECWFDDSDLEQKMVEFLYDNIGELPTISENSSIVDLGTGNGHLLFQLREEGFKGELIGLDYSEASIEFSQKIAESEQVENIEFIRCDLLDRNDNFLQKKLTYDIVLDKGTFDAILLSDTVDEEGKLGIERYPGNVKNLLKPNGILLLTSCNFTKDEVVKLIESTDLKEWKLINYPSFQFGGVKGSTICSVAFIKK